MNPLWHVIRKDLWHVRWLLASWLILTAIPILLGVWALTGSDGFLQHRRSIEQFSSILTAISVFLVIAITVAVIHEDRTAGGLPHWLTLPLTGGQLLLAKLGMLIVAFIGLPLLFLLPWWLGNRFGVGAIISASFEYSLVVASVVLPAMVIASLTDSWARFALWLLLLLPAIPMANGLALALTFEPMGHLQRSEVPVDPVRKYIHSITASFMALTGGLVLINQYRRRRTFSSLLIVGVGCLVALAAVRMLGPDKVEQLTLRIGPEPVLLGELARVEWAQPTARIGLKGDEILMTAEAQVPDFDLRQSWSGGLHHPFYLRWADGTVHEIAQANSRGIVTGWSPFLPADQPAQLRAQGKRYSATVRGRVSDSTMERIASETPHVRARVSQWVVASRPATIVPIRLGERFGGGSVRYKIKASERISPEEHYMELIESQLAGMLPRLARPRPVVTTRGPSVHWIATRSRRVSEISVINELDLEGAPMPGQWGAMRFGSTAMGTFAGVQVLKHEASINPPRRRVAPEDISARRGRSELPLAPADTGWLDGAVLQWRLKAPVASSDGTIDLGQLVFENLGTDR